MAKPLLVTGGTGKLGRVLTERLRTAGHDVRVFSRRSGGDLLTGAGLDAALEGAGTVVHCATFNGAKDVPAAENLLAAAKSASVEHVVYISIVGIDGFPMSYYRAKERVEHAIQASGIPWTILRATQFHELVARIFELQRRLPVLFVPSGVRVQPVGIPDVAARMAEIVDSGPSGRVADLGGPQMRTFADLAHAYLAAKRSRRRIVPVRFPGKIFRAYAQGRHLAPDHADGEITFEDFLAAKGI